MRVRILILGACLMLTACDTSEMDRNSLRQGYTLYSQRKVDESEAVATKFIAANPDSPNLDEALYLRGISRLTRGGGEAAKQAAADDLRLAIQKTTRPDLKAKAYRALGDIDFEGSRWELARSEYAQALPGMTTPKSVTELSYRIGACLQAVGQWDKAPPWFQRAVAANGDPELKDRALARMNAHSFALQFGAFQDGPKAAELGRQLQTAGITPAITSELREGKLLYLVRSGAYQTRVEADLARDRVLSRYPLAAVVP